MQADIALDKKKQLLHALKLPQSEKSLIISPQWPMAKIGLQSYLYFIPSCSVLRGFHRRYEDWQTLSDGERK